MGHDRVEKIWRREGLKVPQKQKPRGRLWLNDGSCVRLRPERENHVWSYDFVSATTHDGRTLRLLNLIDEYTRKCLVIRVARRLNSYDLIETLADVMLLYGIPEHIRSDNVLTAEHQERVRDKISLRSLGNANEFRAKWLPRARVQALDHSDTRSIGDAVVFSVLKTRS